MLKSTKYLDSSYACTVRVYPPPRRHFFTVCFELLYCRILSLFVLQAETINPGMFKENLLFIGKVVKQTLLTNYFLLSVLN